LNEGAAICERRAAGKPAGNIDFMMLSEAGQIQEVCSLLDLRFAALVRDHRQDCGQRFSVSQICLIAKARCPFGAVNNFTILNISSVTNYLHN
jgi:hypothetical protein